MPRRNDIHKILIIGSGPIIIGQACEFDYSGTQACKALRSEGYQIILVNSNPATIMTDPELADRTYIEPLEVEYLEAIIEAERPDALLSTVGGQTALNLSVQLAEKGVLEKYGVELIGAGLRAIQMAEDRLMFKDAMARIGLDTPLSTLVNNLQDGLEFAGRIGYPVIIRPSFTLGGTGGGLAYNREEFMELLARGLDLSPVHEALVEESVLGWKEFELEVMRDLADNVIIICSIENFDPMGVHTGDSITVAPAQTLTDKEYQQMRDAAIAVIREIGVETGGSNIQFAVHPETGRLVVIEMNPRVSRSSALASKATGFPIAKIASKLAVGYRLDEIPNDITRKTPSCFEPTLDYVVVKIPKWAFEKFPGADATLGVQMKSVGEVMAIGRTFKEALLKGLRSLETGKQLSAMEVDERLLVQKLVTPNPDRLNYIRLAFQKDWSVAQVAQMTAIDPWFLQQVREVEAVRARMKEKTPETVSRDELWEAKRAGLSDRRLASLWNLSQEQVHELRGKLGVKPVYKRVDTCAAEFESYTPYLYSCYEQENEADPSDRRKIMILGSGPNRIGQGIEFDYCCCHASFALREDGYETIMVNCNPETVSTDYDTSDRLYFEPLTYEDVMAVAAEEKPEGVIVQFGGQTPLNLALPLLRAGVPIIGTSPDSIDLAEDRRRFGELLRELSIPQPENGTATTLAAAREIAARIGYPVLVRPSYVLGGRAMVIAYDETILDEYMREAVAYSDPGRPILIDRFLEDAIEVDVDALCDGKEVVIAGIMEHIEEAGIHSGDSSCVLPTFTLGAGQLQTLCDYTVRLALALNVVGLMNAQYAIQDGKVYVLEVNPRASRTVPYVSKATGVPLAKLASRLMTGRKLRDFSLPLEAAPVTIPGTGRRAGPLLGTLPVKQFCVKSPVFPFSKFPGVDPILGPEMKSTGEVMGIGEGFGEAFAKAQLSAGVRLPLEGRAFLSVQDRDKPKAVVVAKKLMEIGFEIVSTRGTAEYLAAEGIPVRTVYKVMEGRPNVVDLIKGGDLQLLINTPIGARSFLDEKTIRRAAVQHRVPCITTVAGALAAVEGIAALKTRPIRVLALQDLHAMTVESS
ncbi:MAG: carbamoyl phosphate synthase large subunit [Acidobacteria bacterium RIFCSPLOWO2_02_FULL_61_28]|nr:MAG: carbamoyl phosphate synthase large subunit [Acidobacteria bacterium RIFCSPLOWO2_02_FULL_61_28]